MTLLLVDGHYYLYRSFYAIRNLRNSRGEPTNAIYAFTKALRKMLADIRPTHGAVLWDAGLPEHRVALQPAYKEQRPPMPEDLAAQEGAIMALCPMLGLPSISLPATEADDLIASYAVASPEQCKVVIATSDKDIYQLVNGRISIYSTAKADVERSGPGSGYALLGPREVEEKWGVPAGAIGDVLSLTGDTSDNIPGVPGVGAKTAAALIRQFQNLENLMQQLSEVTKAGLVDKLAEHKELIFTNREMVRLDEEIPLPLNWEQMRVQPKPGELLAFLQACEFKSLVEEVAKEAQEKPGPPLAKASFAPAQAPAAEASPAALRQGELFG